MKSYKPASVMPSHATPYLLVFIFSSAATLWYASVAAQQSVKIEQIELQPLTAQVRRLMEALDYLGAPLSPGDNQALEKAVNETDAARASRAIQDILDKYCLLEINLNPESRVSVAQRSAKPELVEHGWRTFLIKVRNEAGVTAQLEIESLNALPVHARSEADPQSKLAHSPKQSITRSDVSNRWLEASLFSKAPLKPQLSGLGLEYRILQLYSRDAGQREARLGFNVGQGTQDIGFRNHVDILFTCHPSTDVTLRVLDEQGKPSTCRRPCKNDGK